MVCPIIGPMAKYSRILTISDTHFPYTNDHTLSFYEKLKKKYKPDCVLHIGDLADHHSYNFHGVDPNLYSPAEELIQTRKYVRELAGLFPKMFHVDSNHDSLVIRRAKAHGLASQLFLDYRDIVKAPKGWLWSFDKILYPTKGSPIYFHHCKGSSVLRVSQQMSLNVVQGHQHGKFSIEHWSNGLERKWAMQIGCMIDINSLAMAYGKNTLQQPILGTGIIIEGEPILEPLLLRNNKWTGQLLSSL